MFTPSKIILCTKTHRVTEAKIKKGSDELTYRQSCQTYETFDDFRHHATSGQSPIIALARYLNIHDIIFFHILNYIFLKNLYFKFFLKQNSCNLMTRFVVQYNIQRFKTHQAYIMQLLIQTLINTGTFIGVDQAMNLYVAAFDLIKKIFTDSKSDIFQ